MEKFSKDLLEVDLAPDEILTEVHVPIPKPRTGVAHEKLMVMQGDSGIVGAAVSLNLAPGDGICEDVRIALSNVSSTPFRPKKAEGFLIGKVINEDLLIEAGRIASEEVDPSSDVHASAEYRREMVKIFVKRVGLKALERAKGGGR